MSLDQTENLLKMLDYLKSVNLSSWETDFIDNIENILSDEDGFLTDRQIEKLAEIYEKHFN